MTELIFFSEIMRFIILSQSLQKNLNVHASTLELLQESIWYVLRHHLNLIGVSDIPRTFASSLLASWGIQASGSCVVTPAGIKTPLPGLETD